MRGDELTENSPVLWLAMKREGKRWKWALEGMEAEPSASQRAGSAVGKGSAPSLNPHLRTCAEEQPQQPLQLSKGSFHQH